MNKEKLNNSTRLICEKYNPTQYLGAVDCVMPGYFGGNDVMFIAQNPGLLKTDADDEYYDAFHEKNYSKMSITYARALKSSRSTLGTFINDIYSDNWYYISITSVFKCPFENNTLPEYITKFIPIREKQILLKQIEYINPKIIVAIGTIAKKCIVQLQDHDSYMKTIFVVHPSYLKRTGEYATKVEEYKQLLRNTLNAIKK